MNGQLAIEPTKESSFACAEGLLRTVWGHVSKEDAAHAVYYVRWNDTDLGDATFLVAVGDWSEGATERDRDCVAAMARAIDGHLSFMLVDAADTSFADQISLGSMAAADSVRGTPLAAEVFHILDHVLVEDPRVSALRARMERGSH